MMKNLLKEMNYLSRHSDYFLLFIKYLDPHPSPVNYINVSNLITHFETFIFLKEPFILDSRYTF